MKALWAPWRMEFIQGEKQQGCIFCIYPAHESPESDRENLVLGRSARSFVLFNRYPYNSGHLMVVPRRHTADFASLARDELSDLHELVQTTTAILQAALAPGGFNIGMNLGRCAGAGIVEHLHYHVVPRWDGDTNFMPVVSKTKVVIEHLTAAHDKLRPLFDAKLRG